MVWAACRLVLMKTTRIRPGLYRTVTATGSFTIEERNINGKWIWRLSDDDNYIDSWVDDFATKREALQEIKWRFAR